MTDIIITHKIPSAKVAKASAGFLKDLPNDEEMNDPEWVNPENGSVAPKIAKYTNKQWVEEAGRRWYISRIRAGLQKIANEEVRLSDDDSLVETV